MLPSNRPESSLRRIDDDMPQGGFKDLNGADITHFDHVLPAELPPARPWNMVAATLVRGNMHLPRPCTAHRCLERDRARFPDPNRLTEHRWQILQVQSHWSTNATDFYKRVSMYDSAWILDCKIKISVHLGFNSMLRCSWSAYTWQMAYNSQYYVKMSNSMYWSASSWDSTCTKVHILAIHERSFVGRSCDSMS